MAKSDKAETSELIQEANPLEAPGFHVTQEGTYIGTYPSKEDAQAFIDGHITPQHLKAEIVEVKAE